MKNLTQDQFKAIENKVQGMELCAGLGSYESACSIAAINLALTGELHDGIPACMSEVIGHWIISIQDAIPAYIRNSRQWKSLLPLAAGTGRKKEKERLELLLDWMWNSVLPRAQAEADIFCFGGPWRVMLNEKNADAAIAAARAASVSSSTVTGAWFAATAAARAADNASIAARSDKHNVSRDRARCVATTAGNVMYTTGSSRKPDWRPLDPCGTLQRLIEVV
jgi:hypothetical protein